MKLTKWVLTSFATLAASFAATSLLKLAWRILSGRKAPEDPHDLTVSTLQVTLFAVLSAAAAAGAQTLATRGALEALGRWQKEPAPEVEEGA
jgi:hypothetical protein